MAGIAYVLYNLNGLNRESELPVPLLAAAAGVGITALSAAGGGLTYAAGYGFTPGAVVVAGVGLGYFDHQIRQAIPGWMSAINEREWHNHMIGNLVGRVQNYAHDLQEYVAGGIQNVQDRVQGIMSRLVSRPSNIEAKEEAEFCDICQEQFSEGEEIVTHGGPGEKHGSHRECMQRWVTTRTQNRQEANCPACRASFDVDG